MDKNAIKKYAVWARTELIDRVRQRAVRYEVTADANPGADSASGKVLTPIEKTQRQAAIARMRDKGYEYVIEEVAYTWFNRFAALRYMEVNNYLPSRVRVFTDENGSFKPQILTEAIHLNLDGLDMEKVYALKEAEDNDELYKYLLITQCNALSVVLPQMFKPVDEKCKQEKDDYTILLFPDNLLREGSVVEQMVTLITEDNWLDAVQIIGWLYQYYNTELKMKADQDVKSGSKITGKNLPEKTQIFTPDWIVRYMVENSLGYRWLEGHPSDYLKSEWNYFLKEAEQEADVQAQLTEICKGHSALKPDDILCIDPCMGSGHIIVYMFDVLMKIYTDYGYSTRESVQSIIEHNLFGLDIDDRAAQLAYFSVMMKAVKYDSRFLKRKDENGLPNIPQPHIYAIQDSNHLKYEKEYGDFLLSEEHRSTLRYLLNTFQDAKEYGSILKVERRDYIGFLKSWIICAESSLENIMMMGWYVEANARVQSLAKQAIVLSQKYDVVVTNPPYLGLRSIGDKTLNYIQINYPDSKNDFFSVFIERAIDLSKINGKVALVTAESWLSLSSFEKIRCHVLKDTTVCSMLQLGEDAFDAGFGTVAFALNRRYISNYIGNYYRLMDIETSEGKQEAVLHRDSSLLFTAKQDDFFNIPGAAVSYWVSEKLFNTFRKYKPLGEIAEPRQGLTTCDNDRFMRFWHEVSLHSVCFNCTSTEASEVLSQKWFPYNKGGEPRKWYGNNDYVVNWQHNGSEVKAFVASKYVSYTRTVKNIPYYFRKGLTWSAIAKKYAVRAYDEGFIFADKGQALFASENLYLYLCGLMNSKFTDEILAIISPTLDFNCGYIKKIPVSIRLEGMEQINSLVKNNIVLSKSDWNSFENSWGFSRHPLVPTASDLQEQFDSQFVNSRMEKFGMLSWHYDKWERECNDRFNVLKANEEELNRIFIDIYGLQDELSPEVEDKDVTVRKADLQRDIKSLISYAVGCMFGRYSLDEDGLAYAGGEWDETKYKTFAVDRDDIIPICDDEYFDDDITGLFVKFIETVYGKETLNENLKFIADALGGKGTPKEVIRNYFLNDFFADHCKVYQKRPIYWLFDSGKKNGFKALVYMHRYQPDTIARMRTDYVHEQQSRYRTAIADLENRIAGASTSERVRLNKLLSKLQDQSAEIHTYEEKIHHLADRMIAIDLDDGVKHNYEIFKDVLAKIK